MDYATKQIYANYLQTQKWQYFWTGTFKREPSTGAALRAAGKFFQNAGYDFRKGFIVCERGDLYGRVHLHGLLDFTLHNEQAKESLFRQWLRRYGRNSFEEIESFGGTSVYIAKYLSKDFEVDNYDLLIDRRKISMYGVN